MKYNNVATIKELRREYCITQSEMSVLMGLSARNYREKEMGKVPFTQIEIMKMILMFEMESEDVFRLFYTKCFDSFFWKKINLNDHIDVLKYKSNFK